MIKPEQIQVNTFNGGIAEGRSKFLEWVEKVKDRVALWDEELVKTMMKVELFDEEVSAEASIQHGISVKASAELHGFLKDKCSGSAESIVRDNTGGVGLESWRRLCH